MGSVPSVGLSDFETGGGDAHAFAYLLRALLSLSLSRAHRVGDAHSAIVPGGMSNFAFDAGEDRDASWVAVASLDAAKAVLCYQAHWPQFEGQCRAVVHSRVSVIARRRCSCRAHFC